MRLFSLAFLTLYLELALIRFTSAEVLYLGYFSNYVLISTFLGIGLGFLVAERRVNLVRFVPFAILILVAFVLVTHLDVTYLRSRLGVLYFGNRQLSPSLPLYVGLPFLFAVCAFIFAGIAQETARCFPAYSPIIAYSIDVGGSLTGIAVFTLHSFTGGSPAAWLAVAFLLLFATSTRYSRLHLVGVAAAGLAVVLLLVVMAPAHYVSWSPYQKVEVQLFGDEPVLSANGVPHQSMAGPGRKEPIYDFPYRELARLRGRSGYDDVLVIGAGSGTDVAYALHYGARNIDAVEIDPEIQHAGQRFHPLRPFSSDRVHTFIDDGRSFMERATKRYDLIIYALPDSLALYSSLSAVRLESYLFTVESFARARRLLRDDGALVLYNSYREEWLVRKLAKMLDQAFGHPPLVLTYGGREGRAKLWSELLLAAMAVGPRISGRQLPADEGLDGATDDWPFLYLRSHQLPLPYVSVMLLFLLGAVAGVLVTGRRSLARIREGGPFLLLGAAFLLLETKAVIQLALLFGATWLVNSLAFFAILSSVLVANWTVVKLHIARPWWIFGLLLVALAANFAIPFGALLAIPAAPLRYAAASLLLFAPVFLANLLFGALFKGTPHAQASFGWNTLGAVAGGALEYSSLALGYRALSLVAAVLYALAALWAARVLGQPRG